MADDDGVVVEWPVRLLEPTLLLELARAIDTTLGELMTSGVMFNENDEADDDDDWRSA